MHTFVYDDYTRIHYNSDLSGEVKICDLSTGSEVAVPAKALVRFVAEAQLREAIDRMQSLSTEKLSVSDLMKLMGLVKII